VSLNKILLRAAPSECEVSLLRRSDGDITWITLTRSGRHCVAGSNFASLLQDNLLGLTGYCVHQQVSHTEILRPAHTCTGYKYVCMGLKTKRD